MSKSTQTMDGNTAAAHIAYALSDVAAIYPITPSSNMAEICDQWPPTGERIFLARPCASPDAVRRRRRRSGPWCFLVSGALTTTFTASQGLLLMILNMYKISRAAAHGFSCFGARPVDSCAFHFRRSFRRNGRPADGLCPAGPRPRCRRSWIWLCGSLSTIKTRVPFLHSFRRFPHFPRDAKNRSNRLRGYQEAC